MGNPVRDSRPSAPQQSSDPAPSPQPALFSLLESLRCALTGPVDHKAILALRRQIEQQAALIRQAEAVLAGAEIFERASMAARMGTWQCDLPTEQLTWSNGTYELFGLSRSSSLVRRDILKTYTDESLARLQGIRGGALEAGDGFMLDAEIRGPDFDKRWIRISATIERRNGEPVRLFGIKQDITEERRTLEHMRHLAEHDVMTGLANRTRFQMRLADICGPGGTGGVLMLVDLDGFKEINDTMGHAVGDECLIEFTRRLSETCLTADLIARIGGDEFAVIFDASASPQAIAGTAQHLVDAARHPMSCAGQTFCVSASVGFAFAEGETPTALFTNADLALYAAKAVGGNAYRGHAPGRPAGKTAAARNRKRS